MVFFFSSRRRHTRYWRDWSSDVCSSDLWQHKKSFVLSFIMGTNFWELATIINHPILIRVYPHKQGWLDLPHFNSNLSNSHSPSRLIHGIILLQTNTLALLLHLHLLWSSSLPLALHFKLQCFSQNIPIIHFEKFGSQVATRVRVMQLFRHLNI